MAKVKLIEIYCFGDMEDNHYPASGMYTHTVYPECPYFKGDGKEIIQSNSFSDECTHPSKLWNRCSTNHIHPNTCPFDIRKELHDDVVGGK